MKNKKTNPFAMSASRALRDYLRHEILKSNIHEAGKNTLCFCAGFLAQTGMTVEDMLAALTELQAEITVEDNRTKTPAEFWKQSLQGALRKLTTFGK